MPKIHSTFAVDTISFQYLPLSRSKREIRLLRIPPKKPLESLNQHVHYRLFHSSFDYDTEYIALSYTWGAPILNCSIIVNDQSMQITESLLTAIVNLQLLDEEVTVWIDQICINQKDDVEKTMQVQLMRHIYKSAKQVILWIGPSTPQTNCTVKEMRKIGGQLMEMGMWNLTNADLACWGNGKDDHSDAARIKEEINNLARHHLKQHLNGEVPFWWVMSDLGQRMWFKRVWCIQECSNARVATFRCGQEELDFTCYWATALYIHIFSGWALSNLTGQIEQDWKTISLIDTLDACFSTQLVGIRRRCLLGDGHDLRTLLFTANVVDSSSASRIQATDPRDHVFALLGVANDSAAQDIAVDYALSCEDAYIMTARALLKNGHDDILSLCRSRNVCKELPSWVPDWSALIRKPWSTWHKERLFNASNNTDMIISTEENTFSKRANFNAAFVDTIKDVGHVLSLGIEDKFDHLAARDFLNDISEFLTHSNRYDCAQKREAMWRIPIGDTQISDLSGQVERATVDSSMMIGYKIMRLVIDDQAKPEDIQENSRNHGCYMAQMTRMYDSRPFISESGWVGLCPMNTQPGDEIFILSGVRVPYIMRKNEAKPFWTLVGESHCYGIMDREYMQQEPHFQNITVY